jgi:hypothetical protein
MKRKRHKGKQHGTFTSTFLQNWIEFHRGTQARRTPKRTMQPHKALRSIPNRSFRFDEVTTSKPTRASTFVAHHHYWRLSLSASLGHCHHHRRRRPTTNSSRPNRPNRPRSSRCSSRSDDSRTEFLKSQTQKQLPNLKTLMKNENGFR